MTRDHVAARTLVKSPPELWAECSDAGSLGRHIGEFGEIKITRLEPETTVAWEGEHASGTVMIEPSGWGTRVTLTAHTKVEEVLVEAAEDPVAEDPVAEDPIAEDPIAEDPVAEDPIEVAHAPVAEEEDPVNEESADETVEEAVAEPDHALAEDSGPVRRRWRRLIGRFRSRAGEPEPVAEVVDDADHGPEPDHDPEPDPRPEAYHDPEPDPEAEPAEMPAPAEIAADLEPAELPDEDQVDPEAILAAALDSLGQAHHRPFSRA